MAAVPALSTASLSRRLASGLGAAAVAGAVGLFAAGWYYSSEILRPAPRLIADDVEVTAVGKGTVTLARGPGSERPGVWGLRWADGYAQAREILDADAHTVTRRRVDLVGQLQPGQRVQVDAHAYPSDPADAFVFPTERVLVDSDIGGLPADVVLPEVTAPDEERMQWRIAGPRDTWAVLVHGRGHPRSEAFRLLPTLRELGMPALVVSYRNDLDAPSSPDGHHGLGSTEWQDVEAATDYAIARGAERIVLVGFSMGGAIVTTYLHESDGAERVVGAVLDAPVLDWDATLRAAAADRGIPGWLTPVARGVTTLRTGIRWDRLDQVARAEELTTPVLLFHGTADPAVPVETSDAFAAARPDLVTYVRVTGAEHATSWNHDPDAYEARLREFLLNVVD